MTDLTAATYRIPSVDITYEARTAYDAAITGLHRYREARPGVRSPVFTVRNRKTGETLDVEVRGAGRVHERPDWLPDRITEAAGGHYTARELRVTGIDTVEQTSAAACLEPGGGHGPVARPAPLVPEGPGPGSVDVAGRDGASVVPVEAIDRSEFDLE